MNGAKKMQIELLMPESSGNDQILSEDLDRWRTDVAYKSAGPVEVLKERFDLSYQILIQDEQS